MEIRRFLETIYRRLPAVFAVAALAMVVVTVAGILIPPVYRSQTIVRVLWDVGVYDLSPREFVADRIVTTYTEALKSEPVLEEAIHRVSGENPSLTATDLADRVSIEMIPDSELMTIYVQDTSPSRARDLANELATLLIAYAQTANVGYESSADQILEEQSASLENELREDYALLATAEAQDGESAVSSGLLRQIREKEDVYSRGLDRAELVQSYEALRANSVKVISPATLPLEPSNKLGRQEIVLALVIGLCGGIGLALLLESLDTRVRTPEQAERIAQLPVLGTVPRGLLPAMERGDAVQHRASQRLEEPYRLLGASLLAALKDAPDQSIMFTCVTPREGGTEVLPSLAPMLAQAGKRVLLVDANLRLPSMHQHFGLRNLVGLCNILTGQASLHEAVQNTSTPGVSVITSGPVPANPSVLLSSPGMEAMLNEASRQEDVVFTNVAPVLAEPDAVSLAHAVDGVVLQLDLSVSTEEELRGALQRLRPVRAPMAGLVLVQKTGRRRRSS